MFGLPSKNMPANAISPCRPYLVQLIEEVDAEEREVNRLADAINTIISFEPPYYIAGMEETTIKLLGLVEVMRRRIEARRTELTQELIRQNQLAQSETALS